MRLLSLLAVTLSSATHGAAARSVDLYSILKVPRTATKSEIRRGYHKLSLEWHPDKNDSPEAQKEFIKISQAYEVLSDEGTRRAYDETGYVDPKYKFPKHENDNEWFKGFFDENGKVAGEYKSYLDTALFAFQHHLNKQFPGINFLIGGHLNWDMIEEKFGSLGDMAENVKGHVNARYWGADGKFRMDQALADAGKAYATWKFVENTGVVDQVKNWFFGGASGDQEL